MKIFCIDDFKNKKIQMPGNVYREEILTQMFKANDLGGIFACFLAGGMGDYHFHRKRESIIIIISGEAIEVVEGKEYPVKAGDVIFIPAGEKHKIVNNANDELRFLEFFTCPPLKADKVLLE